MSSTPKGKNSPLSAGQFPPPDIIILIVIILITMPPSREGKKCRRNTLLFVLSCPTNYHYFHRLITQGWESHKKSCMPKVSAVSGAIAAAAAALRSEWYLMTTMIRRWREAWKPRNILQRTWIEGVHPNYTLVFCFFLLLLQFSQTHTHSSVHVTASTQRKRDGIGWWYFRNILLCTTTTM